MADEHGIVARGVELAVDRVVQRGVSENSPLSRERTSSRTKSPSKLGVGMAITGLQSSGVLIVPLSCFFRMRRMRRWRLRLPGRDRRGCRGCPRCRPTAAPARESRRLRACSSAVSCWCVVEAGWMTSDLASPMLASSENSFERVDQLLAGLVAALDAEGDAAQLWPLGRYFFARA